MGSPSCKLIAKSLQLFYSVLHSDKFGTKVRSLNGCLFLRNSVNQSHITEDKKPLQERLVLLSPA
jgi:hypothetical protein